MKQWHFFDKVYHRWVVLIICDYEDFFKELGDCKFTEMDIIQKANGMCVELNDDNSSQNCTMVWLNGFNSAALIHELTHLVMMCFGQVDVPISRNNTESFAFYMEYWYTQMTKARKKFPDGNKPSQVIK